MHLSLTICHLGRIKTHATTDAAFLLDTPLPRSYTPPHHEFLSGGNQC